MMWTSPAVEQKRSRKANLTRQTLPKPNDQILPQIPKGQLQKVQIEMSLQWPTWVSNTLNLLATNQDHKVMGGKSADQKCVSSQ